MTSLGNYVVKAELSLDQTPQMPETQTLQQLDNALVVKVILCGVWMWNDRNDTAAHKRMWGQNVLKEILPGSFLSCSSASSNVAKMFWVKLGLLPTTVKPFQTYIISWGGGGQMFDLGAAHPEDENEWERVFSPEQGQVVWPGWKNCSAAPSLLQTSLWEWISQQSSSWDRPPACKRRPTVPRIPCAFCKPTAVLYNLKISTTFSPSAVTSFSGSMLRMAAFWNA